MELQCEEIGQIQVVHVIGKIDSTSAEAFRQGIEKIIANGNRQLLFDFSRVPYINSAGLRVVLVTVKILKEPGDRCAFCGLSAEVLGVFEVAGFTRILQFYPSVIDATSSW